MAAIKPVGVRHGGMALALKHFLWVCSRQPSALLAISAVTAPRRRKAFCRGHPHASSVPRAGIECPHFGACPGCSIQPNESRTPSPTGSRAESFFSNLLGSPVRVETAETIGYRMRSKLAVRRIDGRLGIGLFQSGSHELLEITHCLTHSPAINDTAALVRDQAARHGILAHEESRFLQGALRYVQICCERGQTQVTLVFNGARKSQDVSKHERLAAALAARGIEVWLSYKQNSESNFWAGESFRQYVGPRNKRRSKAGAAVAAFAEPSPFQHPGLFAQANPGAFQLILERLAGMITQGTSLVDLFCGSGVIGLFVCQRVRLSKLLSVEVSPLAEAEFSRRVASLRGGPAQMSAATPWDAIAFARVDLSTQSIAGLLDGVQACILDPPRKGAGSLLLADVTGVPSLRQLVYVSCGFDALEQEAGWLLAHGWRVNQAQLFNLFPGTDSVESLVEFVR